MTDEKVRENRIRRQLDRMGYRLEKSRSRDSAAVDFGLYAIIDVATGGAVNPAIAQRWVCSWDLNAVADWTRGAQMARADTLNHELREYEKVLSHTSDPAAQEDIMRHMDSVTDEYSRDVLGLSEDEIARIDAESEAAVDAQIKTVIADFWKAAEQAGVTKQIKAGLANIGKRKR